MKKYIYLILTIAMNFGCISAQETQSFKILGNEAVNSAISKGDFSVATKLINQSLATDSLSAAQKYAYEFAKDWMARVKIDFSKKQEQVLADIRKYIPEADAAMLEKWENAKKLEMRMIDGEKRYFKYAVNNLYRLDNEAKQAREKITPSQRDPLALFLDKEVPKNLKEIKLSGQNHGKALGFKAKYTLTVKANAVPDGEIIRCWLPFPREDVRRQSHRKLISINVDNYIISPKEYLHQSIYCEKKAEKNKPTEFQVEFSFQSRPEWFHLDPSKIKPYTKNDFYQKYTAEQSAHIIFTENIRKISHEVVGNEINPFLVVKKIFQWIDANFPWASALEYSTMPAIPEYVIENKHGDCGMVSLLFMTLARYNGIPCKWQSGWMFHPGSVNLHDWCEVYFEGIGWVPLDQSFGTRPSKDENVKYFFMQGVDAYHFVVNEDISADFFPAKTYPRSETVDFQRGEVEWRGGNLYFDKWTYDMKVEYTH
jgi:hypothetical protein